jgi:RNA polymerase sigma factor (sigma-70 family)
MRPGGAVVELAAPASELPAVMAAYQQGDLLAFDELYRRLAPGIRRYLVRAGGDPAWAEDLLQETFLRLHVVRQSYRPPLPVEPWAFAIARHVFLTCHRARRRRHDFDSIELDRIEQALPDPASDVLDGLTTAIERSGSRCAPRGQAGRDNGPSPHPESR